MESCMAFVKFSMKVESIFKANMNMGYGLKVFLGSKMEASIREDLANKIFMDQALSLTHASES